MARKFVKIDSTARDATHAGLLRSFIQQQRATYEIGVRLRSIMSNSNDGAVWTDVEALFGLPAGKGETVYDLVNGAVGAMEGTSQNDNCKTIGELLG